MRADWRLDRGRGENHLRLRFVRKIFLTWTHPRCVVSSQPIFRMNFFYFLFPPSQTSCMSFVSSKLLQTFRFCPDETYVRLDLQIYALFSRNSSRFKVHPHGASPPFTYLDNTLISFRAVATIPRFRSCLLPMLKSCRNFLVK